MKEARRLVITGVVQGVGFRYHMTHTALRLGLSGWVRNRSDGSVEAVIAGTPEAIASMIDWSRSGPAAAQVKQVFIEEQDAASPLDGFKQLPTI